MVNEKINWQREFGVAIARRKKVYKMIGKLLLVLVIILVIIFGSIFLFARLKEDSWIKTDRGVWIMHGNPSSTPDKVLQQQIAVECASGLYAEASLSRVVFLNQCLGKCGDYSVDIVNVPRTSDDDLPENQCSDYADGITKHFIELDKNGNIVRIK
jgi:hypothetical protein